MSYCRNKNQIICFDRYVHGEHLIYTSFNVITILFFKFLEIIHITIRIHERLRTKQISTFTLVDNYIAVWNSPKFYLLIQIWLSLPNFSVISISREIFVQRYNLSSRKCFDKILRWHDIQVAFALRQDTHEWINNKIISVRPLTTRDPRDLVTTTVDLCESKCKQRRVLGDYLPLSHIINYHLI